MFPSVQKKQIFEFNPMIFFLGVKSRRKTTLYFLLSTNILDIVMLLDCKNLMNCFYVVSVERCDAVHWTVEISFSD